jgi:hypothetical protein
MAMQYPSKILYICYGSKGILIYLYRGIACALNSSGHKQYPSNNLDQNNSIYGVYIILHEGIAFLLFFGVKKGFLV